MSVPLARPAPAPEPRRLLAALGVFVLAFLLPRVSRPVACDAVLQRALATLQPAIAAAGASVHGGSLPVVRADRRLLERVLRVLVGNALSHAGAEPPVVHISARPAGREWLFAVRDNGRGVDRADFRAIFSPFSGARELPACSQIVRRHGGRIWVESAHGQGATFCFTLPAGREARET